MELNTSVKNIKGVGDKTYELLQKMSLLSFGDLIHFYPRTYDKFEELFSMDSINAFERISILGTVKNSPKIIKYNGRSILSFFISYKDLVLEIKYFNSPFLLKAFKPGDKKVFRGYVTSFRGNLTITQPKVYDYEEYKKIEGTIFPIYPLTKGLSNDKISKYIKYVLDNTEATTDYLYDNELIDYSMLSIDKALKAIHFPSDERELTLARRRIIFEEFVSFISLSKSSADLDLQLPNNNRMIEVADCKRLEENLPYKLTNAQKNAVSDIISDMTGDKTMNRLVQGDVGSGKTIVSVMALLLCAANGYQGALMAPTEVLARQHYELVCKLTKEYKLCLSPILLTGKMSSKDKKEVLSSIAEGKNNVIIGTHALIQDNVSFNNLGLVVTDEQHRFGVHQRENLKNKGNEPHLLVMSATPIPRSLAMIIFAGLSISVIDELPKNRKPISNCVVDSSMRIKVYEKIRSEIKKGHQAYVICPMVFENDDDELMLKSVERHAKDIKDYFGDEISVGSLTGKMKPDEKNKIMDSFKNHDIDILVSTTVIEVGIDVPNATIILIENAERFGLSQLHQLRGRVGRGSDDSFCVLLSDSKNDQTIKRLKILNETNDGFEIAREDMRLRGPGELNGVRQSGELQFGLGDIGSDGDLLALASEFIEKEGDRYKATSDKLIDFRTI